MSLWTGTSLRRDDVDEQIMIAFELLGFSVRILRTTSM